MNMMADMSLHDLKLVIKEDLSLHGCNVKLIDPAQNNNPVILTMNVLDRCNRVDSGLALN